MEKRKWETYLESLKLVDGGDESSDIDIGDFMPASWVAKDYLATGPDVRLFNPRAKENRWDETLSQQRAKVKERAFGRFCGTTKCWILPNGIDPKQYEDGKAYAK